jgi:hypothetical protein
VLPAPPAAFAFLRHYIPLRSRPISDDSEPRRGVAFER